MTLIGYSLKNFFLWPNKRLDFLLNNLEKRLPQAKAIELTHVWSLTEIIKNLGYIKKYKYRSFHLPTKGYKKWLKDLKKHQDTLKLNCLIIHPNLVDDWEELEKYPLPILIENMDNYKKRFKTTKEIKDLFKRHPRLKMCLDLNHLKSNGLQDASKWLSDFKKNIAQIHLSALDKGYYKKWAEKNLRHSLYLYNKSELLDLKNLKLKQYPITLEATLPPNRWDIIKKEFNLVKENLK